jgi:ring-1,2-phenylacetyl-CoA epoxidase subunit PaaE
MNYALSEAEVAQGFILTCQSHPITDKVVVDYDV